MKKHKTRMFEGLRTWNPWFGCEHHCYRDGCWANRKIAPRMRCKQCKDFEPHAHFDRLNRIPRQPRIFVVAHGDLFGRWVPKEAIQKILETCCMNERLMWFFETKNPERYLEFTDSFPKNTVLSTTIETNRYYPVEIRGTAPPPVERFYAMEKLAGRFPIHISIEPIMDFNLPDLVEWMRRLQPMKVAVGYDSLHNNLPEPPKQKTLALIEKLEGFTDVERKQL